MAETTWEVGDQYRSRDWRSGNWATFTVVQVLDEDEKFDYLVGQWRKDRETGKRVARYAFVKAEDLRYATKKQVEAPAPKGTARQWQALYNRAYAAGMAALEAARPTPMVVGTPKNPMASLMGKDDGGFDETQPTYFVEGGVCGFAWVTVYPGTSSFARWLSKTGKARKGYYGGMEVWVREGGQSMQRKEAFAAAFAKVLTEAGIKAYSGSRMD